MTYIDGYVLPLPKKNIGKYKKTAQEAGKIWMKHGALQYVECIGNELDNKWSTLKYEKMAKAKKGETVVFSFITYTNKKHRDAVNKRVMKEMEKKYDKNQPMPFDMKRMAYGGFEAIVDLN
ncbi:DUF1428 domain-containing protein [Candidatus Woesearchaeota archaeon]|nr:MAG: DUF1428 domain-containing protein [Candidatus Woesearchaeota archaeon]